MVVEDVPMRTPLPMSLPLIAVTLFGSSTAAVKEASYPKVQVDVQPAYKPDSAFVFMHNAMAQAIAKRDENSLFALVNRTFIWTQEGELAGEFDLGRESLYNFKFVFGFDTPGNESGPFWNLLGAFAADDSYSESGDTGNLVCGPAAAEVINNEVFAQARKRVEASYQEAEWYFPLTNSAVTKSPNDSGIPVAKISGEAVPVLKEYPTTEGDESTPATHLQVLLPSGRVGWVAISAVRPLFSGRLCYAKAPNGNWKIAIYDEGE